MADKKYKLGEEDFVRLTLGKRKCIASGIIEGDYFGVEADTPGELRDEVLNKFEKIRNNYLNKASRFDGLVARMSDSELIEGLKKAAEDYRNSLENKQGEKK